MDGGDAQALVDLGDFLYWDDPEGARAAYQQAIDAGHLHAVIDLAKVLRVGLGDDAATLVAYGRAAESADPDVRAEALVELAHFHGSRGDTAAARVTFGEAIDTGHAEWAGAAMVGLAGLLLRRLDDPDAAQALYRRAIEAGNPDWSGHASFALGNVLAGRGDAAGARAAWQPVIDAANPEWAAPAFTHLVNLLREDDDVEGLRAAYQNEAARGNPDALYALDVLGQQLDARGDTEGAHAAWQQAIDAGYELADDLRERMSPAEPGQEPEQDAYPPGLPARFDPRNVLRTGIDVLEHGLPALPETLAYQMAIPVAYWTTSQCAVVLVLRFLSGGRVRGRADPIAMQVTYARGEDGWVPHRHVHGSGFSHDPIASPGDERDLDGRPMVASGTAEASQATPGHPAFIATGRAAPHVRYLAVTQDGRQDRRLLDSHFGAWVVCMEQPGPFEVAGIGENGNVLASIQYP
jgi:tetratricopeptide (TPR) repeat protein